MTLLSREYSNTESIQGRRKSGGADPSPLASPTIILEEGQHTLAPSLIIRPHLFSIFLCETVKAQITNVPKGMSSNNIL